MSREFWIMKHDLFDVIHVDKPNKNPLYNYTHVREVNTELDKAIEGLVEAVGNMVKAYEAPIGVPQEIAYDWCKSALTQYHAVVDSKSEV